MRRVVFFLLGCFSPRHRDLRRIEAMGTVEMRSEIHHKRRLGLNMRTSSISTGTGGVRSKRLESWRKTTNRLRLVRAWQLQVNGSENWRSERKDSTIRFARSNWKIDSFLDQLAPGHTENVQCRFVLGIAEDDCEEPLFPAPVAGLEMEQLAAGRERWRCDWNAQCRRLLG